MMVVILDISMFPMFSMFSPYYVSFQPVKMSEDRYRLVVLGSTKVGKSSIIHRYLHNTFSDKYKETVEDLHSRQFRIQVSFQKLFV